MAIGFSNCVLEGSRVDHMLFQRGYAGVVHTVARYAFFFGLFVGQPLTNAASFDCGQARTWVEKTICASSRLSELDDELGVLYRHNLDRTAEVGGSKDEVRRMQRDWLRDARNACAGEACIEMSYMHRVRVLREANAQYEDAKPKTEQEDRYVPPGSETSSADVVDRNASATRATPGTPVVSIGSPPATASVPAAVPSAETSSLPEASLGKANGNSESPHNLLLLAALLQLPLTFWMVYRKTKTSKGTVRGLAYGLATSGTALIALAGTGYSMLPGEAKSGLKLAQGAEEQMQEEPPKAKGIQAQRNAEREKAGLSSAGERSGAQGPILFC